MRVDSGAEQGYEVLPLYDPMIAKLIVWDVDPRIVDPAHAASARRVRDRGGIDLIPFHRALLLTDQWARGETVATSSKTGSG